MRFKRILTATAAIASLTALATACEDPARTTPAPAKPTAAAGASAQASPTAAGSAPATLAEVQARLQKFTSCERLGTRPDDGRLPAADDTKDGAWAVTARGVCTDVKRHGDVLIYLVSDMKAFQQAYHDRTMKEIGAGDGSAGLFSRTMIGNGFVVVPAKTGTAVDLAASDLRIITCNPGFSVPAGYRKEKALVDHCGLTDFVSSKDGDGSPNLEQPHDPAAEGPQKPGQPATGSLGLPSAGSMAELKKLVHPYYVDCTQMTVTDEHVQSIDYLPVVGREGPAAWGVKERAVCGQLGGAQRAHGLNWLDTVSDMKTLQTKAKAAQLADLKDHGRIPATQARLLVGTDIALEVSAEANLDGLYQLQFLSLNCEPGFTAPAGYRLERAQVDGCVLTNFERPRS